MDRVTRLRNISCSILFSSTFQVRWRKFWLLFGQCTFGLPATGLKFVKILMTGESLKWGLSEEAGEESEEARYPAGSKPSPPQPNHPPTIQPITVEPVGVLVKQSQTQQVVDWLKVGGGGGSTGVWVIPTHHELLNTCALYNDFFKARESVLFFMLVPVLLYKIDVTVIVRIRIGLRVLAKSAQSESWFTIRRTKNCYNCLRKAGTFSCFYPFKKVFNISILLSRCHHAAV